MKEVWVVGANDYPDAVFDTEEAADRYAEWKNFKDSTAQEFRRIYYHVRKVPLNPEVSA